MEKTLSILKTLSRLKSLILVLIVLVCLPLSGQESQVAQPAALLHSNDRFGVRLLSLLHEKTPDRNLAIAPLPVSLAFAALLDGSRNRECQDEIISTFLWGGTFSRDLAGKMLLARFERPKPNPNRSSIPPKSGDGLAPGKWRPRKPEEMWFSTALLYRGKDSLSPEFMDRAKHYFGFDFREVGEGTPQSTILAQNWDSSLPIPAIAGQNDFWITSFLHLRTYWLLNTFKMSQKEKHDFNIRSGSAVQADFLTSETKTYPYAHTKDFEAVVLPFQEASILLVLPEPDSNIDQLMGLMVKDPGVVESSLKKQQGDARMPLFQFSYEGDFREPLEKMGLRRIFHDPQTMLAIMPNRDGGVLQGVVQASEIAVDEQGLRADAGTAFGGIFGGIEGVESVPFHMIVNRPFVFLIRDAATNALLFSGVVMDPATH
jgi:serine protease inhibitor